MLFASILTAQGPKPVYQQLFDIGGYYISEEDNNIVHPNNGEVFFDAYILERSQYVLSSTDPDDGLSAGMNAANTRFYLGLNVQTFNSRLGASDWSPGETLIFEAWRENEEGQVTAVANAEVILTQGSATMHLVDENAIALREPPIVLFDSNDEDIIGTTAEFVEGFDPNEDGIYRANNWEDDRYFVIQLSTMGYGDIRVSSRLRRQYVGEAPPQPRGPKYFQTYFSIDDGENWILWGNPIDDGEQYYHSLPDSEDWVAINFRLPVSAAWKDHVLVKWMNVNDQTNQNGWAEIRNVIVTGEETEEPPFHFYPPNNLTYNLENYNVHLTWREPAPFESLIYDENNATGGYNWEGYTMGTKMSPKQYAQILEISYYTLVEGRDSDFEVQIYPMPGSFPSTEAIYTQKAVAVDNEWVTIDLAQEQVFVESDFVVGFGAVNETVAIAYDEDLNNRRSWYLDPNENSWYQHNEAYLIRAVVLYPGEEPALASLGTQQSSRARRNRDTAQAVLHQRSEKRKFTNISDNIGSLHDKLIYREDLDVIGYNVYRDETKINEELITELNFSDLELAPDNIYTYYVTAVYTYNQESGPSTNSVEINVVSADEITVPVPVTGLGRNYPNPFNPTTTINFSLATNDNVEIEVFNSRGQRVVTLIDDYLSKGNHRVVWNGRDSNNREVSSGVYFYRMKTSSWSSTQKMLLIK